MNIADVFINLLHDRGYTPRAHFVKDEAPGTYHIDYYKDLLTITPTPFKSRLIWYRDPSQILIEKFFRPPTLEDIPICDGDWQYGEDQQFSIDSPNSISHMLEYLELGDPICQTTAPQ